MQHGHHPSSVMVWLGVSYYGPTEVHFCEKGVNISAKVYQETVLDQVVKEAQHAIFRT
jgi:aminoglycoside N3'-acetyltransferase